MVDSRYIKMVQKATPSERKTLYKLREKEKKKDIKREYERPERIRKKIDEILKKKIVSRRVFKESPQGTVVFSSQQPHSKHFKEVYEKARWV